MKNSRINNTSFLPSSNIPNSERMNYLKRIMPSVQKGLEEISNYLQETDVTEELRSRKFHLKVIDYLKHKEIENEKLKDDLGSDYGSSDNESDRLKDLVEEEKNDSDFEDQENEQQEIKKSIDKYKFLKLKKHEMLPFLEEETKKNLYNPLKHYAEILQKLKVEVPSQSKSTLRKTNFLNNLNLN